MDLSTKSAFCFLLWSLLMIQWYFSFYYAYFSPTPFFQWSLALVVLGTSLLVSQQILTRYIKPNNKILFLSLFITLLVSHLRILYTHFVVDFQPHSYGKEHGFFLICLFVILGMSFVPEKKIQFPVWVSLFFYGLAGFSILLFKQFKMGAVFFALGSIFFYGSNFSIPLDKKGVWILYGISWMFLFFQLLLSYRQKKTEFGKIEIQNRPEHKKRLELINKIEEMYLWRSKSKKIGKRPFLNSYQKLTTSSPKETKELFLNGDLVGLMIYETDKKKLVIAFRGTNNPKEWVGNIAGASNVYSFTDKTYKHSEINKASKKLLPQITQFLQSNKNIKNIEIMGHSRGAVLAYYVYLQLKRQFTKIKYEIYLYAPPPFFFEPKQRTNITSQQQLKNIHVIFHKKDIMPKLHLLTPVGKGYLKNMNLQVFEDHKALQNLKTLKEDGELTSLPSPKFRLNYHDVIWYALGI